jgi:hypothetical protein
MLIHAESSSAKIAYLETGTVYKGWSSRFFLSGDPYMVQSMRGDIHDKNSCGR